MPRPNPPVSRARPCDTCPHRSTSLCNFLLDGAGGSATQIWQEHKTARSRQILYRAGTQLEHVLVLCEGWAHRFVSLSGGHRMILSFLLPGDMMTATAPFSDRISSSIQMVTAGRYCLLRRVDVLQTLSGTDSALTGWGQHIKTQQENLEQQLVDIGRRSAEERIARLVLRIVQRLEQHESQSKREFSFPLTQQHIADATGLTPIHVSRTLNVFRQKEIMSLSHSFLAIHNMRMLHHIADMEPPADD